jgi:methionyl-tRNA formyltransferase
MKSPRIIFMGTAEFAVASLGSLLMNGFDVAGVVTAPDKPAGRGRKISKSPVKEFAEFSYLPVLQPDNLKDQGFIDALKKIHADIFVVVAFRMLPEIVWRMPSSGTINLHASYLPHYRGAAPVNRVIMNGETVTGVSTFLIDEKIDTGRILKREEVQIFPFENAGDLHDRLMKAGASLLIRTIMGITDNSLSPVPQSELLPNGEKPKDAPKIFPADCLIDWNLNPVKIHNQVRGLAPYPGARSYLLTGGKKLSFKLLESQPESAVHNHKPGTVISDGKQLLKIAVPGGFINILNLQVEGKNRMYAADFLRGFNISGCSVVS